MFLRLPDTIAAEAERLNRLGFTLWAHGKYAAYLLGGPQVEPGLALGDGSSSFDRIDEAIKFQEATGRYVPCYPQVFRYTPPPYIRLFDGKVFNEVARPCDELVHTIGSATQRITRMPGETNADFLSRSKEWQSKTPGEHRVTHCGLPLFLWTVKPKMVQWYWRYPTLNVFEAPEGASQEELLRSFKATTAGKAWCEGPSPSVLYGPSPTDHESRRLYL